MWIHFKFPILFYTPPEGLQIKSNTLLTLGELKCRCCRVEVLFFTKCLLNFWYTLVLFPKRELWALKQAANSFKSSWKLWSVYIPLLSQNSMWFLLYSVKFNTVWNSHKIKALIHEDLCNGFPATFSWICLLKLRDPRALPLPFSKCTLQRKAFETLFLMCCCCCCCWAFQPYAVLSHIIPLWVRWRHWCGLLLLGSLPCISHEDLFGIFS